MNKKRLTIIASAFLIVAICFNLTISSVQASVFYQYNENMENLRIYLSKLAEDNPQKASSSNPYDYITDNKYYNEIVLLGIEVLPYLKETLNDASNYGLDEYICAIAIEDIVSIDLKGKGKKPWATAREFNVTFNSFVNGLERSVTEIVSSNIKNDDKVDELYELGILAIPYLLEAGQKGHNECMIVVESILQDNQLYKDISYKQSDAMLSNEVVDFSARIRIISEKLVD